MSLRKKKKQKKKEEILQSALTLLADKGYHGTTMEEIASHLLMTKGALYYYFKDKQELVYESQIILLNEGISKAKKLRNSSEPPMNKLKKMIQQHLHDLIRNQSGFKLRVKPDDIFSIEQQEEIFRLREKYAQIYDEVIHEGVEQKVFSLPKEDVKIARNLLLGAMNRVSQWYDFSKGKSISNFLESVTDYLLRIVR